jgi:transcription elongation factor GreB
MSKAFTRESDAPDGDGSEDGDESGSEDEGGAPPLPAGTKNYMTPAGFARLSAELDQLWKVERPRLVETIHWAASNGDRSENGDYIYGKKRLREIDRRIRFLSKRLDHAEVVDPATRETTEQVFFGATVTVQDNCGDEFTYAIVGIDEADQARGRISWVSPMARALIRAREGDTVTLATPAGRRVLEVVEVRYVAIE